MGAGGWALVVAVVLGVGSMVWSAFAWHGARNAALDARRAAQRAVEAAQAAASTRAPVAEPLDASPAAPAEKSQLANPIGNAGPSTWRIQVAGGNAGWLLRNEGSRRALDVTLTAEDDEHVTLPVRPTWPYVDRHAAVAFSALPAAGTVNRNVVVEWRWEADGAVQRWVTALPQRS